MTATPKMTYVENNVHTKFQLLFLVVRISDQIHTRKTILVPGNFKTDIYERKIDVNILIHQITFSYFFFFFWRFKDENVSVIIKENEIDSQPLTLNSVRVGKV